MHATNIIACYLFDSNTKTHYFQREFYFSFDDIFAGTTPICGFYRKTDPVFAGSVKSSGGTETVIKAA
jgi:hypothetical protein